MKKLYFNLNSNLRNANLGQVEKGDSIELEIELLQEVDYSSAKFRLLGDKADKNRVEQKNNYNLEDAKVTFNLKREFLTYPGIVKMELNIDDKGKEYTSCMFYFIVSDTINSNIIESIEDVETLKDLENYIETANNTLDKTFKTVEDLEAVNNSIIPTEEERVENEVARKQDEKFRTAAEKDRIEAEKLRNTNEEDRINTEEERVLNEETRKNNELNRKTAENLRVKREDAREQAEVLRQELFEENESVRNENENTRIISENKRVQAEKIRAANEEDRLLQEESRNNKEDIRESNEATRIEAEKIREQQEVNREKHYNDFNDAERDRIEAERNREVAEQERVQAESTRNNSYQEAESVRNNTFEEAERNRSRIYNNAEEERSENEKNRVIEESKRSIKEDAREKAESNRVKAEDLRVEAENTREAAEEERHNYIENTVKPEVEKIEEFGSQVTENANDIVKINGSNILPAPAINFTDFIKIDYVNKKIIFSGGVAVIESGYKTFSGIEYEIPNDQGYIDTFYFDISELEANKNPIKRTRYGNFYFKNTRFLIGVIYASKFTSYFPYKILEETTTVDENKDRLIVADNIYTINNKILPIYKKSILATNKDYNLFETCFIDEANGIFNYFNNLDLLNNSNSLKIGLKTNELNIIKSIKNNVKDNVLNSKSLIILNLGDSLTEGGLSKYLKDELVKYGANPTFIGSRNINGVKTEGRGGWMSSNFTGMRGITGTGGNLIITGDPNTSKNTNPFLTLATEEDKQLYPDFCFRLSQSELEKNYTNDFDKTGDFYIFNFRKYLEVHCDNNIPDIVTIGLGTNDVWKYGTNEINNYLNNIKFMIDRILEVNPQCKIGLIPQTATATSSGAFSSGFGKLIEETLKKYNSEWNNIKNLIIPAWQHMNRDYIFPTNKTEDLAFNSSGSIYQISDHVHFNKYGYYQYVNVLTAWINYVIE